MSIAMLKKNNPIPLIATVQCRSTVHNRIHGYILEHNYVTLDL